MVVFITTGIGNGSVFRVVPTVLLSLRQRGTKGKGKAAREAEISQGEIEASRRLSCMENEGLRYPSLLSKAYRGLVVGDEIQIKIQGAKTTKSTE